VSLFSLPHVSLSLSTQARAHRERTQAEAATLQRHLADIIARGSAFAVDTVGASATASSADATSSSSSSSSSSSAAGDSGSGSLWVDKYRPTKVDQLVGMAGIAQKLTEWLRGWTDRWLQGKRGADEDDSDSDGDRRGKSSSSSSASAAKKPKTASASAALTGLKELSKCVLLSGPPGVGKTSCASLIAEQMGYEVVALNASDARSKKVIKEQFSHLVQNRSMSEYFTGEQRTRLTKRTLLIMDEVGACADRGWGLGMDISYLRTCSSVAVAINVYGNQFISDCSSGGAPDLFPACIGRRHGRRRPRRHRRAHPDDSQGADAHHLHLQRPRQTGAQVAAQLLL
jgi:hypothetical protein